MAAAPIRPGVALHDGAGAERDVAKKLQAIRDAVSKVTAAASVPQPGDPNIQKAQWLNWLPSWRNGGCNNWRNNWSNGWNNWHNGWRNW